MSDFLPIGLGRDNDGVVSGLQEIKVSDTIPEQYLTISNDTAKWNASGLQGYLVSSMAPTDGYVLTWESSLSAWIAASPGAGSNDADFIQGIPVCTNTPTGGQFLVYNSSIGQWCPSTYTAPAGGGSGDATSLNMYEIPLTTPADGDLLIYNDALASYLFVASSFIAGGGSPDTLQSVYNSGNTMNVTAGSPFSVSGGGAGFTSNNSIFAITSPAGSSLFLPSSIRLFANVSGATFNIGKSYIFSRNTSSTTLQNNIITTEQGTGITLADDGSVFIAAHKEKQIQLGTSTIDSGTGTKSVTIASSGPVFHLQTDFEQNVDILGAVTASNISTTATASYIPKAKSSGKIDYTWLEEASIDDYVKGGVDKYTAWYAAGLSTAVALTNFTLQGNKIYAMPFVAPRRGGTVSSIEIYVSTGAASTSAIMGVYENLGEAELYPGTLVASGVPELATTTTAQKRTWDINYTLKPGQLYWLTVVSNGTPIIRGLSTNQAHYILGTTSSALTTWTTHLYADYTYNTSELLPSTFPTTNMVAGTAASPGLFYTFSA